MKSFVKILMGLALLASFVLAAGCAAKEFDLASYDKPATNADVLKERALGVTTRATDETTAVAEFLWGYYVEGAGFTLESFMERVAKVQKQKADGRVFEIPSAEVTLRGWPPKICWNRRAAIILQYMEETGVTIEDIEAASK